MTYLLESALGEHGGEVSRLTTEEVLPDGEYRAVIADADGDFGTIVQS